MEEKARKRIYFGVLLPSEETLGSTSVKHIAKFLGVSRQTIYNNLSQSPYYQSLRYHVGYFDTLIKMNRRLSKSVNNLTRTQSVYPNSKSVDKPTKELTYEPLFD